MFVALDAAAGHFLPTDQPLQLPSRFLAAIPLTAIALTRLPPFRRIDTNEPYLAAAETQAVTVYDGHVTRQLAKLPRT